MCSPSTANASLVPRDTNIIPIVATIAIMIAVFNNILNQSMNLSIYQILI